MVPDDKDAKGPRDASGNVVESNGDPAADDVAVSERDPQPEDWNRIAAQPLDRLEREMQELHRVWDRHSYAAWVSVMQIIPRVRAFKEHVGGNAFHERCRKLCRIGKTAAGNIVRWGIAEPNVLTEIWDRVHAEIHAAAIRGERYEYPSLSKMCGWYKPEDEVTTKPPSGDDDAGDEEEEDEGSNDPRSKMEIARQNIMLEDHLKSLTRKLTLMQQRLADRDADFDKISQLATEQKESLALSRQLISEQKAEIATKDAEIARLRAEMKNTASADQDASINAANDDDPDDPPKPPGSPDPLELEPTEPPKPSEPPEPPQTPKPTAKRTLGEAVRTEIDAKWAAPKLRGGSRASDENKALAKANRIAAFDLLDDEPSDTAQAAAAALIARTISFFWQLLPDMTLDAVLALPEKPK
jgi:hypothetical protein